MSQLQHDFHFLISKDIMHAMKIGKSCRKIINLFATSKKSLFYCVSYLLTEIVVLYAFLKAISLRKISTKFNDLRRPVSLKIVHTKFPYGIGL